jgi:hypothetical protein
MPAPWQPDAPQAATAFTVWLDIRQTSEKHQLPL